MNSLFMICERYMFPLNQNLNKHGAAVILSFYGNLRNAAVKKSNRLLLFLGLGYLKIFETIPMSGIFR